MFARFENPQLMIRKTNRLNRSVITGFIKLVDDLVTNPKENKKCRDELSHNIFLMLQECNKFREHQAREILIETLEKQLEERTSTIDLLKKQISNSDSILSQMHDHLNS
mmetsp:Transcript_18793/g.26463  ORF Transcript_18793/g.26463 Transcript_18793/m.26463 type:complete len:109 (+) Transcript_18793:603-929(+)